MHKTSPNARHDSPTGGSRCWRAACAALIAALLASCGGGASDWTSSPDSSTGGTSTTFLSGTVAAGAPVVGIVELKDSVGARKQAQIASDGSYKVGLKGLTLPLLLRATGYVGGHKVVLVSAATAADSNGVVNITPFTDLIVANAAGMAAEAFYATPDFSKLSSAQLDEARVMITQRIAPIMAELAVDTHFDLRRSAFVANHTRFDAVLDVLRVTVDADRNTATIDDVVTSQHVEDDLTELADHAGLPTPAHGTYAAAIDALVAIDAQLVKLNQLFASSTPSISNATLQALFDPDFLYDGLDLAAFLTPAQLLSSGNVGVQLVNPVIVSRASDGQTLRVRVQVLDTLGHLIPYDQVDSDELEFRKDASGAWRIAGDRRMGDVSLVAVNSVRFVGTTVSHARALEFWVPSAANAVSYVGFTGAGLPASTTVAGVGSVSGVVLQRTSAGFMLLDSRGQSLSTNWLPECSGTSLAAICADLASVTPNTTYTVTFYDANLHPLGDVTTLTLPLPPAPLANATAQINNWFAAFASYYPEAAGSFSDGALIRLGWVNPADPAYQTVDIGLASDSQSFAQSLNGKETSKILGRWSGAAPARPPQGWIWISGPHDRAFVVTQSYAP